MHHLLIGFMPVFAQVTEAVPRETLWKIFGMHVISAIVFAAIGLAVFGGALWLFVRLAPFSVRKEIEEDHNVALAIIMAAMLIGISTIIAAAIQG